MAADTEKWSAPNSSRPTSASQRPARQCGWLGLQNLRARRAVLPIHLGEPHGLPPDVPLFADAEAGEDPPQEVLARELARHFRERLLRGAQLLGHELTGARLAQLPCGLLGVRPRAAQGLQVPAARTH